MSDEPQEISDPPEWMRDCDLSDPLPGLSDRDWACAVLPGLDYDSQLLAIHKLLTEQQAADEELRKEIEKYDAYAKQTSGFHNERAVEEWIYRVHHSVYQDAAHSMAAVGLIAPFIESVFCQAFQGIGRYQAKEYQPYGNQGRWKRPAQDQWDCHFVWTNGRRKPDLVKGILQLADAIELTRCLPKDLQPTLEALFAYRNKMFHCGFEWPIDERSRFEKRLAESGWPPGWFSKSTSNNKPWIFYMSNEFVQHCLRRIGEVITGIGVYCKEFSMNKHHRQKGQT